MSEAQEYSGGETLKRWRRYRGLWRDSLDDKPSLMFVFLLFSAWFAFVTIAILVHLSFKKLNNFTYWLDQVSWILAPVIVYGGSVLLIVWGLLYWARRANNRAGISCSVYFMLFPLGWASVLGSFVLKLSLMLELSLMLKPSLNLEYADWESADWIIYWIISLITFSFLLLPPILVAWIQGWRQALIFIPILVCSSLPFVAFAYIVARGGK